MPQRRCWVMRTSLAVAEVSRKVAIGGGIRPAISAMLSSGIIPGPLGIEETRPNAEAPLAMEAHASSRDAMQQILTRGLLLTPNPPPRPTFKSSQVKPSARMS